jgi:hypothetical protein
MHSGNAESDMPTKTLKKSKVPSRVEKPAQNPLRMKTWKEAREYLDTHLTPCGFTPAGRPVYDSEDVARLNILLPDE